MSELKPPKEERERSHRIQVAWFILAPVVLAGLAVVGLLVMTSVEAGSKQQTVSALSSVTTIFLLIPVCLGGIVNFVLIGAMMLGVVKLRKVTPRGMRIAQNYVKAAGIYAAIGMEKLARPHINLKSKMAGWAAFWRNLPPKRNE